MADTTDHKAKMLERQKEHRKTVSDLQDPEKGLVLVHTGKGKGKSSSAFGVVIRALGWGHKVGVVQFIKGKWKTGGRLCNGFLTIQMRVIHLPQRPIH